LGRVLHGVVEEIKALDSKGFTQKEIAEKTGVSPGSVRKYLADGSGKGCEDEVGILFEAFFSLLSDLSFVPVLDLESITEFSNERALETAKKIFFVNRELGKKVLASYLEHLRTLRILDLKIPDNELPDGDARLRRGWMALLKEQYPEKLATLV